MNAQTPLHRDRTPSELAFAVQLVPLDPRRPAPIAGRIEHVLSGRRHDFDNGAALLACLALERSAIKALDPPPETDDYSAR